MSIIYTLAGASGIDVSANMEIVKASQEGIEYAFEFAGTMGWEICHRPYINVSVGLKGDPHVRKARISEELCIQCKLCINACEQKAIDESMIEVIRKRCIGCGACEKICPVNAVVYETKKLEYEVIIPKCLREGAETLELHAMGEDEEQVMRDWQVLCSLLPNNFISICMDRSKLSDEALIQRIRNAQQVAGDRLVIQADGAPMSGGQDDYNTTLQSIAIADMIRKNGISSFLLLSGGTNSKTGDLARLCNVDFNGISIGTFARKLVKREIQAESFDKDAVLIRKAVQKAKWLIDANFKGCGD